MKLRWLLLGAFLFAGAAFGQTYDCRILFSIPAAGTTNTAQFDNRSNGCDYWTVVYQADTVATISLNVQSAPGAAAPGTWGTFSGTVVSGINPNTSIVGAQTILSGFNSWIRVHAVITSAGTPLVNGVLYGYHSGYNNATSAGCPGTVAVPCVVDGVTAAGSPPTTAPVLIAGQDGAPGNIRTIKTDAVGQPIPANASSADADAISNTVATATGAAAGVLYPRVFDHVFNGTTWDRMVGNTSGLAPTNASSAAADALSNTELSPTAVGGGVLYPRVFGHVFNGTTWDRQVGNTSGIAPTNASSATGDALSATELSATAVGGGILYPRMFSHGFNGTTFDRLRTAALANVTPATTLTARNSIGASLAGERGSRFTVVSNPAAGTVASASIASEASVRHVADHVCFSAAATGAVVATAVGVTLRDGATGAGTIIAHFTLAIPVASATGQQEVQPFCTPALDLVGTTATAMTAEFNTGVTNLVESITLTGYNVN